MTQQYLIKTLDDILTIIKEKPDFADELIADTNCFLKQRKEFYKGLPLLEALGAEVQAPSEFTFIPDGKGQVTNKIEIEITTQGADKHE